MSVLVCHTQHLLILLELVLQREFFDILDLVCKLWCTNLDHILHEGLFSVILQYANLPDQSSAFQQSANTVVEVELVLRDLILAADVPSCSVFVVKPLKVHHWLDDFSKSSS